ncbi:MAG: FtsX-like permease family protein, partial [Gemmatimonadaceae bacterium]
FRSGASITPTGFGSIDAQTRFVAEILTGFAVGALLLSAIGLYGIVAYGVSQRTREIGIRIALGATHGRVIALVLRDGVQFVMLGAVAGLAGALVSTRLLRAMLFQTTTTDPTTLVVVALVLAVAALVATYLPARRAAHTDPTIAIRAE